MKFKFLMVFYGVFTFLLGLFFMFLPAVFLKFMGTSFDPETLMFARLFGALLAMNGIYFYGARETNDLRVVYSFCLGSVFVDGFATVVIYIATRNGLINWLGYPFTIIFLVTAILFAWTFYEIKKDHSVRE